MTFRVPKISVVASDSTVIDINNLGASLAADARDYVVLNYSADGTFPSGVSQPVLGIVETRADNTATTLTQTFTDWRKNVTYVRTKTSGTWGSWTEQNYSDSAIDTLLAAKADASSVYTKTEADTAISDAIDALINGAPGALDTLNEIAAALGNDANLASTLTNAIAAKADASDVYTKTQVDTALSDKANVADVYTKSEVDTAVAAKADASSVYTKTEVDAAIADFITTADLSIELGDYALSANVYTKSEVDTAVAAKADASSVYTKTEVDAAISGLLDSSDLADYYTKTEVDSAVSTAVSGIVGAAPAALDTLFEIAAALNNDGNLAATLNSAIAAKADASSVYTKTEVDSAIADFITTADLGDYALSANVYTKSEVDTAVAAKADASSVYTKTEIDAALALKADASSVYTKTEVDSAIADFITLNDLTIELGAYALADDVYTKSEVDTAIAAAIATVDAGTVGQIVMWPQSIVTPAGWLTCDGSTVSQATYADLSGVLGTTYNNGSEAANTFRLPLINFVDGLKFIIKS